MIGRERDVVYIRNRGSILRNFLMRFDLTISNPPYNKGVDIDIHKGNEEMEKLETPNTFAAYEENFKGQQRYWILRINGYDKEKLMKYLRKIEVNKAFILTTKNPLSSEIPIWNCETVPVPDAFNKAFVQYYGPFKRKKLLAPMDAVSESDDELDRYMRIVREIEGVVSVERIGNEVVVGIS